MIWSPFLTGHESRTLNDREAKLLARMRAADYLRGFGYTGIEGESFDELIVRGILGEAEPGLTIEESEK